MALLFLTRGTLFHEPTWELFFQQAEGLVPVDPFRRTACNATTAAATKKYCSLNRAPGAVDRQVLFNVYVHTSPSFPGFPAGSLFHGREIGRRVEVTRSASRQSRLWYRAWSPHALPDSTSIACPSERGVQDGGLPLEQGGLGRSCLGMAGASRPESKLVQAKWGTHTLIEAARNLFQAALEAPSNHRFVMLSESGIPLYPPTLIWQQLMSESKSRINACQHPVSSPASHPPSHTPAHHLF